MTRFFSILLLVFSSSNSLADNQAESVDAFSPGTVTSKAFYEYYDIPPCATLLKKVTNQYETFVTSIEYERDNYCRIIGVITLDTRKGDDISVIDK